MGPDNGGPGWSADPHGFSMHTGVGAQRMLSWGTLTSPVLQDPELSTERLEPLDGAPISRRKGKGAAYTLVINQKVKHPQHKQAFRVSCKGQALAIVRESHFRSRLPVNSQIPRARIVA